MTKDERKTFCRIVSYLILSDLQLHDTELRYLESLWERLGVDEAEQVEIKRSVNVDDDIRLLAASLPVDVRKQLLQELYNAAYSDGVLVPSEAKIIRSVEDLLR